MAGSRFRRNSGLGMGMSIVAPGGARARRLSTLLAGTALVSVAALSMSVTDAVAACTVTRGRHGRLPRQHDHHQHHKHQWRHRRVRRPARNSTTAPTSPAPSRRRDGQRLRPPALAHQRRAHHTIGVTNSGTVTTNQAQCSGTQWQRRAGQLYRHRDGLGHRRRRQWAGHYKHRRGRRQRHQQRRIQLLQQ